MNDITGVREAPDRLAAPADAAAQTRADVAANARPVLIADDDKVSSAIVGEYLGAIGLSNPRVFLFDGEQVIDELQRRLALGGPHLPVLVLLDGSMPGKSGLEVLRYMREVDALADIPVVLLSAQDSALDVTEAYELGARSYLIKPVGYQALGAVVRSLPLPWVLV